MLVRRKTLQRYLEANEVEVEIKKERPAAMLVREF